MRSRHATCGDGTDLMTELWDPRAGDRADIGELFERVLDDPELNTRESLLRLARELHDKQPPDRGRA